MNPFCSVIIITYNCPHHIEKAVDALNQQTRPANQIILVDTGSKDPHYLEKYRSQENIEIYFGEKDCGFCVGNNIGYSKVNPESQYVFLLNPDAFLTNTFLEEALAFMEAHPQAGAITGTTLGYEIDKDQSTGLYDTTGIFRTWYGHWFDRAQAQPYQKDRYNQVEEIPAICGAVFFCRKKALDQILIHSQQVLNESFYMYKEDIDLSLRLVRMGWKLYFVPQLIAYHCRGWNPNRRKMAKRLRLCSAYNELRIHLAMRFPIGIAYSSLKYLAVRCLNM
jgi:N-acetylglucosaminyl-diphospho-decaprenol L-rhamnosyltransferase